MQIYSVKYNRISVSPHPPSNSSICTSTWCLPILLITHEVNALLPVCAWLSSYPLGYGNLPVTTSSIKKDFHSPYNYQNLKSTIEYAISYDMTVAFKAIHFMKYKWLNILCSSKCLIFKIYHIKYRVGGVFLYYLSLFKKNNCRILEIDQNFRMIQWWSL